MRNTQFLDAYINKLVDKINSFDQQWKGTRFASIDQSTLEAQDDDDQIQYEQFLQKYRGKNGEIKPLGLILFHKYLCGLFTLFLALSLLFVPIAIVYSFGEGLPEFKTTSFSKSMLVFSIANLPRYRLDDLTADELSEISLHRYLTLSTDIISILVIFAFVLYFKVLVTRVTREYMAKSPTPNLYCLQVENIEGCEERDILQHFLQLGKVSQISYIYTHKDLVYDLRKMVKLVTHLCHLKPDDSEYDSIFDQIQKKYKLLAKNYLMMPKPHVKSAFVCFESITNRNRVHDLYKFKINPEKLDIKLEEEQKLSSEVFSQHNQTEVNMKRKQSEGDVVLNHKCLTIRPIVKKCKYEPLTINWQNCDIDKKSQTAKFCCQFVLLIIVAFVILLGLFLININSSHVKQTEVSGNLSNSPQKNFGNQKQIRQKYTFCASLKLSNFKLEYYNLCSDYLQFQRNRFALMLTFALMISVINLLTNRILWALVAFRRYRTMAERNTFLMTSIFIFSLVNSAILILCIRGHYTGPILRKIVGTILNFDEDLLEVTVYSQFNRNWYMNIGAQLMMNYVVSLIMFPNFHILLHWIRSKYRAIKAKRTRKIIKKPVFNYVTFYAMSLKSIFFGLMYSNCMPVFYLLCCFALAVQMGVGRLLLNKFVDEPVFVDNSAIDLPINLIPYALLLHCLTSVLFLSVEEIYPTEDSYENIHASWIKTNLLKVERGYIYVIIFILISIYIYNRQSIDALVLKYWIDKEESKGGDRTKRFKDIRSNPAFLTSYKMKDNPKYKILHYALQLFTIHMQKIREDGCFINQSEDLNITTLLQEESMQNKIRNLSQLNHTNITKTLEDEHLDAQTLVNEELVHSMVWSQSDSTARKQDGGETKKFIIKTPQ